MANEIILILATAGVAIAQGKQILSVVFTAISSLVNSLTPEQIKEIEEYCIKEGMVAAGEAIKAFQTIRNMKPPPDYTGFPGIELPQNGPEGI